MENFVINGASVKFIFKSSLIMNTFHYPRYLAPRANYFVLTNYFEVIDWTWLRLCWFFKHIFSPLFLTLATYDVYVYRKKELFYPITFHERNIIISTKIIQKSFLLALQARISTRSDGGFPSSSSSSKSSHGRDRRERMSTAGVQRSNSNLSAASAPPAGHQVPGAAHTLTNQTWSSTQISIQSVGWINSRKVYF